MKRSTIPLRFVTLSALALTLLLAAACGGGGSGSDPLPEPPGGGGGVTATFTGDANNGDPGDVSMEAGASSGGDFDVDVKVNGPLVNLFGVAFRIDVPADIRLLPGSSSNGSVLLPGAASTIFDVSQTAVGEDVLVTATRVQPQAGFDSGVDLAAGLSHLMTLRFRATDATAGNMNPTNTGQRQCDVPSETCPNVVVVFTGGDITAN